MSTRYQYRPRTIDIRIVKPPSGKAPKRPAERVCEHPDCKKAGDCRAPKDRSLREYVWFCADHAAEYNRAWNFFAGMSDDEFQVWRENAIGGERPTWPFRASSGAHPGAQSRAQPGDPANGFSDTFGVFRGKKTRQRDFSAGAAEPEGRNYSRVQNQAFEILNLEPGSNAETIRARYSELVKRLHPDSNGGDRTTEPQLVKVIRAYKALKSVGLA